MSFLSWFQPAPQRFTLHDFMAQIDHVQKLGPAGKIVELVPGLRDVGIDEHELGAQFVRMRAIYSSMNNPERDNPDHLNGSRRRRIARGAAVSISEVEQFARQFELSREMMDRVRGNS